jgi:hypothetical protein
VDQQGLGLRAGDALHLAVAAAWPVLGVVTGVVG